MKSEIARKILEASEQIAEGRTLSQAQVRELQSLSFGADFAKSKAALARALAISRWTVTELSKRDDFPRRRKGRWNVAECRAYFKRVCPVLGWRIKPA